MRWRRSAEKSLAKRIDATFAEAYIYAIEASSIHMSYEASRDFTMSTTLTDEEKYIPVPKAIEKLTGHRPSPATCIRYIRRGISGQVLQTWFVGNRRYTTLAATRKWIDAVTDAKLNRRPDSVGAGKVSDSESFLDAEGV